MIFERLLEKKAEPTAGLGERPNDLMTGDINRHLAIFMRFSLLSSNSKDWRIAKQPYDAYRDSMFSPERLEFRLWTLANLALPSIVRSRQELFGAGSKTLVTFHILTSNELPGWAMVGLEEYAKGFEWVSVHPLPASSAYPGKEARAIIGETLKQYGDIQTIIGTANIDDDDVIGHSTLTHIDRYLSPSFVGMAVSPSYGLVGMLDAERREYVDFRVMYAPKIALGTTMISSFAEAGETSSGAQLVTCYDLGSHVAIDQIVPVITEATKCSWVRTMHFGNDVLHDRAEEHWTNFLPHATSHCLKECDPNGDLPVSKEWLANVKPGPLLAGARNVVRASKQAAIGRRAKATVNCLESRRVLQASLVGQHEITPLVESLKLDVKGSLERPEELLGLASYLQERKMERYAARLLEAALPLMRAKSRRSVRVRLYYLLCKLGEKKRAADFLTTAAGKGTNHTARAFRLMKAGKQDEALKLFQDTFLQIAGEKAAAIWTAAFRLVHASSDEIRPVSPFSDMESVAIKPRAMFAVSGMGWSGSGAVFDFLCEFQTVKPLRGEARLIEGKYGLAGLLEAIREGKKAEFLPKFLGYSLAGADRCRNYNDFRHVRNARRAAAGAYPVDYAASSLEFLHFLKQETELETSVVVDRFQSVFQNFVRSAANPDGMQPVLLDNVVHISNLELAQFFPTIKFIAVIRDPRDQYIDNVRENKNFKREVEDFVAKYRQQRDKLKHIANKNDNVIPIVFEQFVTDVECRRQLVSDLGFEFSDHVGHKYFVQEISARNIGLFNSAPELSAEIKIITSELGEFLNPTA